MNRPGSAAATWQTMKPLITKNRSTPYAPFWIAGMWLQTTTTAAIARSACTLSSRSCAALTGSCAVERDVASVDSQVAAIVAVDSWCLRCPCRAKDPRTMRWGNRLACAACAPRAEARKKNCPHLRAAQHARQLLAVARLRVGHALVLGVAGIGVAALLGGLVLGI